MTVNKRIIFHFPAPFSQKRMSGSQVRPWQMYQAFQEMGYQVDLVVGYVKQRQQAINRLKAGIRNGMAYDCIYSESLTIPIALSEQHHCPLHPFVDVSFFRFCQKKGIPIAVFYRDVQWRFKAITGQTAWWKRRVAKPFYYYDLWCYRHFTDRCYLPHLDMLPHVPGWVRPKVCQALPPAASTYFHCMTKPRKTLRLLYVGGMVGQYRLHRLFEAVYALKHEAIALYVCCRQSEWQQQKSQYAQYLQGSQIEIHHVSGESLVALYEQVDIGCFVVEPHPYMRFAMPVKLFEYLSYDKPSIVTQGLASADFVAKQGIGWAVDYRVECIKALLLRLLADSSEVLTKAKQCHRIKQQHTWSARARQVAVDMQAVQR